MKATGTRKSPSRSTLACGDCGSGLPPPDINGRSHCVYCGAKHEAERSSEILPMATPHDASSPQPPDRESTHDGEEAARIPMTEDAVLRLLRQQFGDVDPVFLCPHIPPKQERLVREAHVVHLPEEERILALHDASWLGNGPEGFLVTARRLCWKNAGGPACAISWRDLDPAFLGLDRRQLFVTEADSIAIADEAVLEACANAFHVLSLSAVPARPRTSGCVPARDTRADGLCRVDAEAGAERASFGANGPFATLSFDAHASEEEAGVRPDRCCWHCRTPLLATTPQCGYCGMLPKKSGWLRTG